MIEVKLLQNAGEIPNPWNIGAQNYVQASLELNITQPHDSQVISGEILKNNSIIGHFTRTQVGTLTETWYGGKGQPIYVKDSDVLKVKITSHTVTDFQRSILRGGQNLAGELSLQRANEKAKSISENAPLTSVIQESIRRIGQYSDFKNTKRTPQNIESLIRYSTEDFELQPIEVNIFGTEAELQNALDSLKPITQKDIFDEFPRFVFPTSGQTQDYWTDPSQATGGQAQWEWQEDNQRVYMPLNQAFWSGFVSAKKYDRYDHEMTTGSTDGDDDWNQVVIQHKWENGINHLLVLTLSPWNQSGTTWEGHENGQNVFSYGGGRLSLNSTGVSQAWDTSKTKVYTVQGDQTPNTGWSGKERRVGIYRREDLITVKLSDWNSGTFNESLTMTLDLNSDQFLQKFKGPQSYGYTNMSQGKSYYKDIFFDGGERMDQITDQRTGDVYTYDPGVGWSITGGVNLQDIYGQPRVLRNSQTNKEFMLGVDGSLTPL